MSVARPTHDAIFRDLRQSAPWEDFRRLRTLAWAVTGLVLEQDARVACQALAFDAPDAMNARVRRGKRLLVQPGRVKPRFSDNVWR